MVGSRCLPHSSASNHINVSSSLRQRGPVGRAGDVAVLATVVGTGPAQPEGQPAGSVGGGTISPSTVVRESR